MTMKIVHMLTVVALISVPLIAPDRAAADAVSACGQAEAKVSAQFVKSLILESTRACVSGSAQNPGPLDVAKLQAVLDKAIAAIQTVVVKFGAPNCYPDPITTDITDVVTIAQKFANRLCRVP